MTRVPLVSEWEDEKQVGYKMGKEYPGVEEELDLFDTRRVGVDGFDGRDSSEGYGGRLRNSGCFFERGWLEAVGLT